MMTSIILSFVALACLIGVESAIVKGSFKTKSKEVCKWQAENSKNGDEVSLVIVCGKGKTCTYKGNLEDCTFFQKKNNQKKFYQHWILASVEPDIPGNTILIYAIQDFDECHYSSLIKTIISSKEVCAPDEIKCKSCPDVIMRKENNEDTMMSSQYSEEEY